MKAIAAALALLSAAPALAQQAPYAHRDVVLNAIEQGGGTTVVRALSGDGRMLEIHATEDGEWIMTATAPSGITCMVAGGDLFTLVDEAPGEDA